MPVNFVDFLSRQSQESYRPFIVHGAAGSGKTSFAKRAVSKLGKIAYLDLLEYFIEKPDLARVDLFRPPDLRRLLVNFQCPEPVLLVDNLDFLLNTWSSADKRSFLDLVEHDLRSPGDTSKTIGFFIQSDPEITVRQMLNTRKESRVLALDAIQLA